jgi:hypothetical protein
MPVSLTIRDIPEATRDEGLPVRRAGQSLEEYVLGQLMTTVETPDAVEYWDRVRNRLRATGGRLPAEVILEARDHDRR